MIVRMLYLPLRLASLSNGAGNASAAAVKELQERLSAQGYYHGALNGVYDLETKQAVETFQKNQSLTPDGIINPRTFCRLFPGTEKDIAPAAPDQTRQSFALPRAHILIAKSVRQLTLFSNNTPFRQFPVAIGKASTPTPDGNYQIINKIPNPGGMLGTRWMGLSNPGYGIHGTNADWLIGQMVSHGCVRMHNSHAEELFALINIGTPVLIRS